MIIFFVSIFLFTDVFIINVYLKNNYNNNFNLIMKKIFYWSPCLNRVGTTISTINSAISVKKYSYNRQEPVIINSCGEWDEYLNIFNENNIKVLNFYSKFKYFKYLPKKGYIASRVSYLIIYIFFFFPYLIYLKKITKIYS